MSFRNFSFRSLTPALSRVPWTFRTLSFFIDLIESKISSESGMSASDSSSRILEPVDSLDVGVGHRVPGQVQHFQLIAGGQPVDGDADRFTATGTQDLQLGKQFHLLQAIGAEFRASALQLAQMLEGPLGGQFLEPSAVQVRIAGDVQNLQTLELGQRGNDFVTDRQRRDGERFQILEAVRLLIPSLSTLRVLASVRLRSDLTSAMDAIPALVTRVSDRLSSARLGKATSDFSPASETPLRVRSRDLIPSSPSLRSATAFRFSSFFSTEERARNSSIICCESWGLVRSSRFGSRWRRRLRRGNRGGAAALPSFSSRIFCSFSQAGEND